MKRLLLSCLALLLAGPAAASQMMLRGLGTGSAGGVCTNCMVTPILSMAGSSTNFPSTAATNYIRFIGGPAGGGPSSTIANEQMPIGVAGTISNLEVNFPTAMAQGSYAVSLNQAGSSKSLTCTINSVGPVQTCNDSSDVVTVAPGDLLTWQVTPTGTPTAQTSQIKISATFTSTVGQESPLFGGATANNASAIAINFASFGASQASYNATENVVSVVTPAAGTIDQLYVALSGAAGASATYQVTVEHGGSDTSLTCTTAANGSTCTDTTGAHAFTVAQGDTISIKSCPSNTATCPAGSAPTARTMNIGVRWVPTTAGQAMLFDTFTTVPTTNSTRFGPVNGTSSGANSTEVDLNITPVVSGGMTLSHLTVLLAPVPGGATTRAINLRAGNGTQAAVGTPGNVTCTVGSAATTCTDNTNSYSSATGTYVNWQTIPTGTNAALTQFKVGMVVTVP